MESHTTEPVNYYHSYINTTTDNNNNNGYFSSANVPTFSSQVLSWSHGITIITDLQEGASFCKSGIWALIVSDVSSVTVHNSASF